GLATLVIVAATACLRGRLLFRGGLLARRRPARRQEDDRRDADGQAAGAPELKKKQWADFFDYEERLNQYLSDKAMLVLCAYPLAAPRAADVTRTHPSTIRKRRGKWEVD